MPKPHLIAVAGVVGVGKTTLAENLAQALSARLIREEYDRNPFLPGQWAGDADAALPSELFFLFSRARQLHKSRFSDGEISVCDYLFQKNRIFSQLNLDSRQFEIYLHHDRALEQNVIAPATVIYLHDTLENCLDRIARRGRPFEKTITCDWLEKLRRGYDDLIDNWDHCRVIRLDCGCHDVRRGEVVEALAGTIFQSDPVVLQSSTFHA
jgi:deoxyguanosine kinase